MQIPQFPKKGKKHEIDSVEFIYVSIITCLSRLFVVSYLALKKQWENQQFVTLSPVYSRFDLRRASVSPGRLTKANLVIPNGGGGLSVAYYVTKMAFLSL